MFEEIIQNAPGNADKTGASQENTKKEQALNNEPNTKNETESDSKSNFQKEQEINNESNTENETESDSRSNFQKEQGFNNELHSEVSHKAQSGFTKRIFGINLIIILPLYLEIVSHLILYKSFLFSDFVNVSLVSLCTGLVLYTLSGLFNPLTNKILTFLFSGVLTVYYIVQVIYHEVFGVFLSLYTALNVGTDVLQFTDMLSSAIISNIPNMLALLVPLVLEIILAIMRCTDFKRRNIQKTLIFAGSAVLSYVLFLCMLLPGKNEPDSDYEMYYESFDFEYGEKSLGMMVYLRKDFKETYSYVTGKNTEKSDSDFVAAFTGTPGATGNTTGMHTGRGDTTGTHTGRGDTTGTPGIVIIPTFTAAPIFTPTPAPTKAPNHTATPTFTCTPTFTATPTPVDRSPHVLDIDFDNVSANTSSSAIKWVNEYFKAETPSNKNEYTGMFEGYNLIFITAEAWSPLAVSEELTPTLYKMINSCFKFNNFYNPIWYTSTVDGEFAGISGLIPEGKFNGRRTAAILDDPETKEDESKSTGANFNNSGKNNSMPYALGNMFLSNGYNTYGYHNWTYNYYYRNSILNCFGMRIYRGYGGGTIDGVTSTEYGLNISHRWPESDIDLITASVDEYLNDWKNTGTPFQTYYMTVSGHTNYSWSGNQMSRLHQWEVADLPYTETLKAYIAANLELEYAVQNIIEKLTEYGALQKTVIVINADHYPYGLENAVTDYNKKNIEADYEKIYGKKATDDISINLYFSEFYGHDVDLNFERFKNNLVIWNAQMTKTVEIDKVTCPMDILPTLYNLFGFTYDSRLLMGRDALSEIPGLVPFNGQKKILTDNFKRYYDETKGKWVYESTTHEPVHESYVNAVVQEVKNRFTASKYIIDNDYFSEILKYLK